MGGLSWDAATAGLYTPRDRYACSPTSPFCCLPEAEWMVDHGGGGGGGGGSVLINHDMDVCMYI
jgi:hypothetical protein